jgi:NADPH-dependent 2,4-dienoyl-CoA reductase/sulfur reductase-like enzyme
VPASPRGGFVAVGGSLAGVRAAESARRSGYRGPVTLVGSEPQLPYDRPPLSKEFLTTDSPQLRFHLDLGALAKLDIDLRLAETATGIDGAARRLFLGQRELPYDKLVIATGSSPRRVVGLPDLDGLCELRTAGDARGLRERLVPGTRLVVVGAGLIGSEVASAARERGADVTIIEAAQAPLARAFGQEIGAALATLHPRHGVRLICGTAVQQFAGTDRVEGVELTSGEQIAADVVVVGIGSVPATEWLNGSAVDLDPSDGSIACDEYLRTSVPDVYAAGDVASWPNSVFGTRMRLENWSNASDQGIRAGVNAVDPGGATPYATVPYFWSDWYKYRIQFVGTAKADTVLVVDGDVEGDKFLAFYREGDRLVGAAGLNEQRHVMKLRRLIGQHGTWEEALGLVKAVATP